MTAPESAPSHLLDRRDVRHFITEVRGEMLERNYTKYHKFLQSMEVLLRVIQFLPQGNLRGSHLHAYYMLMRHLDDIADGDISLPEGYLSSQAVLEDLIEFVEALEINQQQPPATFLQGILAYCFRLGRQCNVDLTQETRDILTSLRFDAQRKGTMEFCSEEDLQQNYHRCDIRGTVRGCLKFCREETSMEPALEPLGKAVRIFYNLRDFIEENHKGLFSVSKEDAERFRITPHDLQRQGIDHPGAGAWWMEQVALGMDLLRQHRSTVGSLPLQPLTRLVLWRGYERPAQRFFQEQIQHIEGARIESMGRTALRFPFVHGIAIGRAVAFTHTHQGEMGIPTALRKRYVRKSANLALCYEGFAPHRSLKTASRAALAAFLGSMYDFATDATQDEGAIHAFKALLERYVPQEARDLALHLLQKDTGGTLDNDGLERGATSMQFIAIMMGIRESLEKLGIPLTELGELLQIVDDVIDQKDDQEEGQMSCLCTPRRHEHLQRLLQSNIHALFPGTVLQQVIIRARLDARLLLRPQRPLTSS